MIYYWAGCQICGLGFAQSGIASGCPGRFGCYLGWIGICNYNQLWHIFLYYFLPSRHVIDIFLWYYRFNCLIFVYIQPPQLISLNTAYRLGAAKNAIFFITYGYLRNEGNLNHLYNLLKDDPRAFIALDENQQVCFAVFQTPCMFVCVFVYVVNVLLIHQTTGLVQRSYMLTSDAPVSFVFGMSTHFFFFCTCWFVCVVPCLISPHWWSTEDGLVSVEYVQQLLVWNLFWYLFNNNYNSLTVIYYYYYYYYFYIFLVYLGLLCCDVHVSVKCTCKH
jgi:hypothetical protein